MTMRPQKYPANKFARWGRKYGNWVPADFEAFRERAGAGIDAERFYRDAAMERWAEQNIWNRPSIDNLSEEAYQKRLDYFKYVSSKGMRPELAKLNEQQGLPGLARKESPTAKEYIEKRLGRQAAKTPGMMAPQLMNVGISGRSGDAVHQAHENVEKRRLKKLHKKRLSMDAYVHRNPEDFKEYLIKKEGKYSQAVKDYIARHPDRVAALFA